MRVEKKISQAERSYLKETTTAVDREKAGKMFELNEKYKDYSERISKYEINGKK
jgi:conserved domain protein